MTASCGDNSRFHTDGSAAGDHHFLFNLSFLKLILAFFACQRVDQAGHWILLSDLFHLKIKIVWIWADPVILIQTVDLFHVFFR